MFSTTMSKLFKSAVLLITLGLILNELCFTEAAPSLGRLAHKLPKFKAKFNLKKRAHFEPIFDEVNRCILACGKCSDDLYTHDDKEVWFIFNLAGFKNKTFKLKFLFRIQSNPVALFAQMNV